MNFSELLNPGTTLGAFVISIAASIVAGAILGFFSGRKYEKKNLISKSKITKSTQFGEGNINIQNSKIER